MGFNRSHTMKSDACAAPLLSHRSCGIFRAAALIQQIRPKLMTSSTNSPQPPKSYAPFTVKMTISLFKKKKENTHTHTPQRTFVLERNTLQELTH